MAMIGNMEIVPLHMRDATMLSPLLAEYTQSLKRGAPRHPDDYYAEMLLQDRVVEIVGAKLDGALIGFAVFFDLPDPLTGRRYGLMEHLYISHDHRRKGIANALIDVIADQADERGWAYLAFNAPRNPADGRRVYERFASPADWTSHVIHFDQR